MVFKLLKSMSGWNQVIWKPYTCLPLIPVETDLVKFQKAETAEDVFWDLVQRPDQTSSSSGHGLEATAATC